MSAKKVDQWLCMMKLSAMSKMMGVSILLPLKALGVVVKRVLWSHFSACVASAKISGWYEFRCFESGNAEDLYEKRCGIDSYGGR